MVEALEQLTRALGQIATLPSTPALRHEEIKLQVALIYPLQHVKGLAAPETRAAAERARLLTEQAEALGEPTEDPLLLFSALHALWTTYVVGFNGDVAREGAAQFLALAEKQGGKVPLLVGHHAMSAVLVFLGNFAEALPHQDRVIALYDPVEHRPLATRFGVDTRVNALIYRSLALWALGYPEAALAFTEQALSEARETSHAGAFMNMISITCLTQLISGNYATAKTQLDEMLALAEEKALLPGRPPEC
jgi:tetratricopeptide (TPR) repeat protein